MAPALTEPLSPNNTLSASTSSASPRPSISNSTANNFLKNTNHFVRNGNSTNKTDIKSNSPLGSTATTSKPLNGIANNNINNTSKNFGIIENNKNHNINNSQKNSLFRRSLTSTCAFQSAFEESIKKAGFPLPEPQSQQIKKTKNKLSSVAQSILNRSGTPEDQDRSNSPKENYNNILTKTHPIIGSKENLSNNFHKKVKTEPLYIHQNNINNKISPKPGNNNNNTYSNNLNSIGKLTNGPSSLLSTSSIVCNSIETKATSATTLSIKSNQTNKLMGPMSDITQQDSHDILSEDFVTIPEGDQLQQSQQQQSKNKNILQGFIPIDKNFEKVLKATLKVNNLNNNNKQDQLQCEGNEVEKLLLKLEDLQQMDLPNSNDNNDNNVNINDKTIILSSNVVNLNDANIVVNKISGTVAIDDSCENVDGKSCLAKHGGDGSVIIECDSRNQQVDIEFSQEIRSTGTTETTVSASEGENNFLEDNFQETQTLCHSQENTPNRLINRRSPPKTPTSSQHLSQIIGTPASSILTPQSIGLGSSAMGLQKDFKDSEMDDQVLSDMDLLQVLKGLDSTTGGDNLCDLAGNLGLFNDVDVMNYEEIAVPNLKETDVTLDIRSSIEKCHQQMERKCEYLVRRLRKLQSRYMGKHTSEEICGLFEWTNRLVRRKDQHEQIPSLTYEEDKHRPVSATSVRTLLRKIDLVAKAQHSNASDPSSQPLKKYKCSSRSTSSSIINSNLLGRDHHDKKGSNSSTTSSIPNASSTVIKSFDEKTCEEIGYVSGLLHSEVRQVQCAFDSDATASSSGGESADEMVTYNNQLQQSLSISKRAGWRWARDRAAIASRWTWLLAQISDLEYRIRQHNELYQHIRKNKGFVALETSNTECSTTVEDLKNSNLSKSITEITSTTIDFGGDRNQTDIITSSGDNITINSTNVNGYRGTLLNVNSNNNSIDVDSDRKIKLHQVSESGDASILTEDEDEELSGACRTRAFQRLGFRKRKLLQTANVHTVSKKAARPSTIKCGCQWPFNPCALCTGRPDPTAPRDLPDTMMPDERIALLDSGYHPVLSFTEDVPTSIHIEAILHMPEWQNKLIRSMSKSSKSLGRKSEDNSSGHNKSGEVHTKRPYNKSGQKIRKDTLATPSTNKIKKSRKNHDYPSGFSHHSGTAQSPQSSSNLSTKNKYRKPSSNVMMSSSSLSSGSPNLNSNNFGSSSNKSSLNVPALINTSIASPVNGFQSAFAESLLNNFQCDNLDGSSNGVLPRSKNASPTPGNAGNHKHERALERKNRNSYDIDNIVIPYSVAASTRVELLPYKEIPTPKWRVIGDELDETEIDNIHSSVEAEIESLNKNISDSELCTTKSCFAADELLTSINKVDHFDDLSTIDSHDNLVQDGIFLNEDDFDEDISTEAIQSRHDRALLEERRKFSTYLKFPWSTRSRANRRIDSRAESSGANTPDPTSPAPHTPSVAGDQESIPSPAAPSTPLAIQSDQTDVDIANPNFGHRRERKRTVSSKKDRDIYGMSSSLERRSQSPDPRDIIPPYEPLQFPIPDDIFEKMLQLMPNMNDDIDDNSNLISGVDCISNSGTILNTSNAEIVDKKLNSDKNGSRKNSFSLNISDTFNDNSMYSSTSINNEFCKNNNSKNNCLNNSLNNNNNSISRKKTNITLGSSTFNEYFDSNDKNFVLHDESDTDSAESGLEEDPNDPEWKEPE